MDLNNNYSFRRIYTLTAHTPIIHFQHRQSGATLRATEVKPKLDSFIKKKMAGRRIPGGWFVGDSEALNYKLHFSACGRQERTQPPRIYYGNAGVQEESRAECVKGNCRMEIICFIPELMAEIQKYVAEFFVCTNFGRMQNKGFGSFTVQGESYSEKEIGDILKDEAKARDCYYISGYKPEEIGKIFDDISTLYGVMKSGYNMRGSYHRSYLFEYFIEKGIGNEKAYLKKKEVAPYDNGEPVKHPLNRRSFYEQNYREYKYVRALLGVGEQLQFISGFKWGRMKNGKEGYMSTGKERIKIKNASIERLESPIFFKIIDGKLYMVAKRVNDCIFNKEFTFTNVNQRKSISVSVPGEFDIDDFLDWFVKKYNIDSTQKDKRGNRVLYSIGKKVLKV